MQNRKNQQNFPKIGVLSEKARLSHRQGHLHSKLENNRQKLLLSSETENIGNQKQQQIGNYEESQLCRLEIPFVPSCSTTVHQGNILGPGYGMPVCIDKFLLQETIQKPSRQFSDIDDPFLRFDFSEAKRQLKTPHQADCQGHTEFEFENYKQFEKKYQFIDFELNKKPNFQDNQHQRLNPPQPNFQRKTFQEYQQTNTQFHEYLPRKPEPQLLKTPYQEHKQQNQIEQPKLLPEIENLPRPNKFKPSKPKIYYSPNHKQVQPANKDGSIAKPLTKNSFVIKEEFSLNRETRKCTQDKYIVFFDKKLGTGAFGSVYECQLLSESSQKFAVKIITNQKLTLSVKNEIKINEKLNHPNILRAFDSYYNPIKQIIYIVLEYCEKGTLRDLIKSLDLQTSLTYFKQIVQGLKVLQDQGVIHRDMKLENILIKEGQAKISDFGFAKLLQGNLEVFSQKCGTPATMAPEILFQPETLIQYDFKNDIWSLGVILFEMVYKTHPFGLDQLRIRQNKRVPVVNSIPIVDDLLDQLLQTDPKKRFSIDQVLSHPLLKMNLQNQFKLKDLENDRVKTQKHSKISAKKAQYACRGFKFPQKDIYELDSTEYQVNKDSQLSNNSLTISRREPVKGQRKKSESPQKKESILRTVWRTVRKFFV